MGWTIRTIASCLVAAATLGCSSQPARDNADSATRAATPTPATPQPPAAPDTHPASAPTPATPTPATPTPATPAVADTPPPRGARAAGGEAADRARLEQLERAAMALVRDEGCQASGDCRAAPLGSKGCGGPRRYIVYCARATDSAALNRSLEALRIAEVAFNRKYQIGSTCEMALEPRVEAVGGRCRTALTPGRPASR